MRWKVGERGESFVEPRLFRGPEWGCTGCQQTVSEEDDEYSLSPQLPERAESQAVCREGLSCASLGVVIHLPVLCIYERNSQVHS